MGRDEIEGAVRSMEESVAELVATLEASENRQRTSAAEWAKWVGVMLVPILIALFSYIDERFDALELRLMAQSEKTAGKIDRLDDALGDDLDQIESDLKGHLQKHPDAAFNARISVIEDRIRHFED